MTPAAAGRGFGWSRSLLRRQLRKRGALTKRLPGLIALEHDLHLVYALLRISRETGQMYARKPVVRFSGRAALLALASLAFSLAACATATSRQETDGGTGNTGRPGRPDAFSDAGRTDPDDVAPETDSAVSDDDASDDVVGESDVVDDATDTSFDSSADVGSPDTSEADSGTDVPAAGDTTPDAVQDVATDTSVDVALDVGADADSPDAIVTTCTSGSTRACYGGAAAVAGIGECAEGVERCVAGTWGACEGWVAAVAESCGDGRDNDCDAETDEGCAPECVAPTRVISNIENDSVHALFVGRGLTLQEPFSINATHFAGNDVVLVDALYVSSGVTPAVVNAFLDRGGTAIFFTTSLSTTCNRINNDNFNGTGLGLGCATAATGAVSRLLPHPLTDGLSAGQFPSTYASSVTGGTAIAQVGSVTIAAALERGCGRMIVVGNGDLADSAFWPTTSAFWSNAVRWMVDRS